jgi:hypothetical protein
MPINDRLFKVGPMVADGYSRFSGKIGLAATTQGPGYINATTSLLNTGCGAPPPLRKGECHG